LILEISIMDYSTAFESVPIEEFDDLARKQQFQLGPFISDFGEGYGEPYTPDKNVWGMLYGGRKIRSVKVYK
jgi:hypothetical protein